MNKMNGLFAELKKKVKERETRKGIKSDRPTIVPKSIPGFWSAFSDLSKLEEFSDLTIIFGTSSFKVHKLFVYPRSSELRMLSESSAGKNEINLTKLVDPSLFSCEAVEKLVEYFYTGKLESANCVEMYHLVKLLQLKELEPMCLKRVKSEKRNAGKICGILNQNHFYGEHGFSVDGELHTECIETVLDRMDMLVKTSDAEFVKIPKNVMVEELLKNEYDGTDEYALFRGLQLWHSKQPEDSGAGPLQDYLKYIRFPLFEAEGLEDESVVKMIPEDVLFLIFRFKSCGIDDEMKKFEPSTYFKERGSDADDFAGSIPPPPPMEKFKL